MFHECPECHTGVDCDELFCSLPEETICDECFRKKFTEGHAAEDLSVRAYIRKLNNTPKTSN